jgi:RNA polymerase sigma factor (sigma-70 family)
MSGKEVCPDVAQSRNAYNWQREIEYSIASWGKTLSRVGEYVYDGDGKFVHDAYNELVQELSLAILDAGKKSGKRVQGDPYCREGKLNAHVVEVCKNKIKDLKEKAFSLIQFDDPEEKEDPESIEVGIEQDPEECASEDSDGVDQESVCTTSTVPLDRPDDLPDPKMEEIRQEVEDSADIRTAKRLIKTLPEIQQQVLGLYYRAGGSFRSVAEILGKDEKEVRRIHARAIESLRKWMVKPKII